MQILRSLIYWMCELKTLTAICLSALLVVSALGVSYSTYQTRNMYRDLQSLEKERDDLEHEYEKLLLEQSAWADYSRLDQLAQDELAMEPPATDEMVVIR